METEKKKVELPEFVPEVKVRAEEDKCQLQKSIDVYDTEIKKMKDTYADMYKKLFTETERDTIRQRIEEMSLLLVKERPRNDFNDAAFKIPFDIIDLGFTLERYPIETTQYQVVGENLTVGVWLIEEEPEVDDGDTEPEKFDPTAQEKPFYSFTFPIDDGDYEKHLMTLMEAVETRRKMAEEQKKAEHNLYLELKSKYADNDGDSGETK